MSRLARWLSLLALCGPLVAAQWEPVQAELYDQGMNAIDAGNLSDAQGAFERLLLAEPDCGRAMVNLAVVYLRLQRTSEAQALLERAGALYPDEPDLLLGQSLVAFVQQDFAASLDAAERAVKLDPTSVDALIALERVMLRLGETRKLQKLLDKAEGQIPKADLACLRIDLLIEQGDSAAADALMPACDKSLREDMVGSAEGALLYASGQDIRQMRVAEGQGQVTDALVIRAIDSLEQGKQAEALAILERVQDLAPRRVDAAVLKAQALDGLGRSDEARVVLQDVFDAESWVEIHSTGTISGVVRKSDEDKLRKVVKNGASLLVFLQLDAGDLDGAGQTLRRAYKELGPDPALLAAQASLLVQRDAVADAWPVLVEAAQLAPDDDAVLRISGDLAFRDPAGLPDILRQALQAYGDPVDRFNLAAGLANSGDAAGCLVEARPVLELAEGEIRERLLDLAHGCALAAKDVPQADALYALGGARDVLTPAAVLDHATLRYLAGDKAGAVELARSVDPGDDERQGARRANLLLNAGIELKAWDVALEAARHPAADPQNVAYLANELFWMERQADALPLLEAACPQLLGEVRAQCDDLLGQAKDTGEE